MAGTRTTALRAGGKCAHTTSSEIHDGVGGRRGHGPSFELAQVGEVNADAGGEGALVQVLGPPELPETRPEGHQSSSRDDDTDMAVERQHRTAAWVFVACDT